MSAEEINFHNKKFQRKIEIQSKSLFPISFFLLSAFFLVVGGAPHKFGTQMKYAIIYDCGSTGTRIHAYRFNTTEPDGRLMLDNEQFFEAKPELSFFHAEPNKAVESIEGLLDKVKSFVPEEFRSTTPIALKATAGLRLLPSVEAENLLNAVRGVLSRSGFLVKDNAVEIMDGSDEGIFSWFALNVLLGRSDNVNLGKNTVAALDMGGGSTQVSFALKDPSSTPSLVGNIRTLSTSKSKMDVFTRSYLHMGLGAVRPAVFTNDETINGSNYASECVNPIVKSANFTFLSKTYYVSGKNNSKSTEEKSVVDFLACAKLIRNKLMHLMNPKPITLNRNEIVASGAFHWLAVNSGLVPGSCGEATVEQVVEKAKEVCATVDMAKPFMCLDLTYLTVLLTHGYGFDLDKKISFYKQIDGHEISWALGCAYNLLAEISWSTNRAWKQVSRKRALSKLLPEIPSNSSRICRKYFQFRAAAAGAASSEQVDFEQFEKVRVKRQKTTKNLHL